MHYSLLIISLNLSDKNQSNLNISNLPIYAQLPQNIGMQLAQLFSLLASLEFAYFAAPRSAQALFITLHSFSAIVASYIRNAYTFVLQKHEIDLDFDVSIKIERCFFIILILIILLVSTWEGIYLALCLLFLNFCRCSVSFHYCFYRMPEKVSDGQVKSTKNGKESVSSTFIC
jgi:hypothetical protein